VNLPNWKMLCPVALFVLCSCANSKQLSDGHLAYNEAIRLASDQEVLLNIVRLRYQDSVEFLSTTSINSTISFSVEVDGAVGRDSGATDASLGVSAKYSNTPTFSFTPQRGNDVAKRLNDPVDISTLVFLASVSRDADHIFRLLVTWMNGLKNDAAGPDPEFLAASRELAKLQYEGSALMAYVSKETEVSPVLPTTEVSTTEILHALDSGLGVRQLDNGQQMVFTRTAEQAMLFIASDASNREVVLEALHLDAGPTTFPIIGYVGEDQSGEDNALYVRTRSVLHSMAYLSQGVTVPPEDLASGVAVSPWPDQTIDPTRLNDIFRVYWSKKRPKDASVAVQHRGHWFYVRDNDAATRRTFFLVTHALRFILEQNSSSGPVLTLPVAG